MTSVKLSFLRHAKVPSHEGDMPLTEDSRADIDAAVPRIMCRAADSDRFLFLATRTNRSRQTAEAIRTAIAPDTPEVQQAWGLRNPDLYLAGARVEMMSTAEAIAAQVKQPALAPEDVMANPFFHGFLTHKDRIGYWLTHPNPPGESAAQVGERVLQFARSFPVGEGAGLFVICVTHSPVLRALLLALGIEDPGEPGWVEAVEIDVTDAGLSYRFRDRTGRI